MIRGGDFELNESYNFWNKKHKREREKERERKRERKKKRRRGVAGKTIVFGVL
jgi:hypothetical protein